MRCCYSLSHAWDSSWRDTVRTLNAEPAAFKGAAEVVHRDIIPDEALVDLVLVLARAVLSIRAQHVDELAHRDAHLLQQLSAWDRTFHPCR